MTQRLLLTALLAWGFSVRANHLDLVSEAHSASLRPFGDFNELTFSNDGALVAFSSNANNLVANDHNGFIHDLFVKTIATGEIKLITRGTSGSANGHSYDPLFSPDGKYLLFISDASNLVPGDDNQTADVFRAHLADGTLEKITPQLSGYRFSDAANAQFSPDGTKILFESYTTFVTATDTNDSTDAVLFDLARGTTTVISRGTNNRPSAGRGKFFGEIEAQFTPNGLGIVFEHTATNLVTPAITGDAYNQIYHYSLATARIRPISVTAGGEFTIGHSELRAISRDGDNIAFVTSATNLGFGTGQKLLVRRLSQNTIIQIAAPTVSGVANPGFDSVLYNPNGTRMAIQYGFPLYIYDIGARTYKSITGTVVPNAALEPLAFSPSGNTLFFTSEATNIPGHNNTYNYGHFYTYNLTTENIRLLSVDSSGAASLEGMMFPAVSANAQIAGFAAAGISPGVPQRELATVTPASSTPRSTPLIPIALPRESANRYSSKLRNGLSADGSKVLFYSFASDLLLADEDTELDYFLYDLAPNSKQLLNVQSGGPSIGTGGSPLLTANGRYIVFVSTNSYPGIEDTNNAADVYRLNIASGALERVSIPRTSSGPEAASHSPRVSADGEVIVFYTTSLRIGQTNPGMAVRFMPERIIRPIPRGTLTDADLSNGSIVANGEYYLTANGNLIRLEKVAPITIKYSGGPTAQLLGVGHSLYAYAFGSSRFVGDLRNSSTNSIGGRDLLAFARDNSAVALSLPVPQKRQFDIQLYDPASRTTRTLFSIATNTVRSASLSNGGRHLLFSTFASLTPQDQNDGPDIYLYDVASQATLLISRTESGAAGNGASTAPDLSEDGTIIAFTSAATDLHDRDLNHGADVFIYQLEDSDSDNDTLPDTWEITWFSNLEQTATGDFDQDGSSNAAELSAGTNPTNGASALMVTTITNLKTGGISLLWQSTAGKRYQVQSKESLATPWQNLGEVYTATQSQTEAIDPTQLQPARFYRILLVD